MTQTSPLGSSKDPVFVALRKLRTVEGRAQSGSFLIEDLDALRVAVEQGHVLRTVLICDRELAGIPSWLQECDVPLRTASAGLLHKLFPTGKTPTIAAECAQLTQPLQALRPTGVILVLEDIQDAGNLGSMLRTAEGLGVRQVVLLRSGVTDLYNRVAVRASMGSLFRLQLFEGELDTLSAQLGALGGKLVVTTPHTPDGLAQLAPHTGPLAMALGNESHGASQRLLDAADVRVRIPMATQVESLNVGAACAIALYAVTQDGV